jgi:hypothetical protein
MFLSLFAIIERLSGQVQEGCMIVAYHWWPALLNSIFHMVGDGMRPECTRNFVTRDRQEGFVGLRQFHESRDDRTEKWYRLSKGYILW